MSTELVKHEPNALERAESTLEVISRLAVDPRVDVEKLERLLVMKREVEADQRRVAFLAALARLATKLPEIDQKGRVAYEGKQGKEGMDRKYARLEDIDRAIRPLLSEEGFSMSFDTHPTDSGKIRVSATLSHRDGHSETKQLDLPHDSSGSKNGIQAVGSTVSYGRRMLVKMFFNLIEHGEDTDGNDPTTLTDDQAKDLEAMISEVRADKAKFLQFMGVDSLSAILARDHTKAINALETKRNRK